MRVLVRRSRGGHGDQLCCLVALRAARQMYPSAYLVYATSQPYYGMVYRSAIDLYGADECIAPPLWPDKGDAGFLPPFELSSFDRVVSLDGPEVEYAHAVDWKIEKSRIEIWCDAVGLRPEDMIPRLARRSDVELHRFVTHLAAIGLKPFEYIVVHYKSADPIKDYPHNRALIEGLRDRGYKVVVMHHDAVPQFSIEGAPVWATTGLGVHQFAMLVDMAQAVICPDSFILHLAAAMGCPTVGLFSSTDGAVATKHYPLVTVLQHRGVAGKDCEQTFPCYGLYGLNCWCANRTEDSASVPWCLEQITPAAVIESIDRKIADSRSLNAARRASIEAKLRDAGIVKVDRLKYMTHGKNRPIVVGLPPGIGDSLWAMVKIQDIMVEDRADSLIVCLQETVPARGIEFIERFDFVTDCMYRPFPIQPPNEYFINADGTYNYVGGSVGAVRQYMGMDLLLVPNAPLERGERLEKWLPEFAANWNVMKDHFQFRASDDIVAERVSSQLKGRPWVTFFLGSVRDNGGLDATGRYHVDSGHNRARRYTRADWKRFGYLDELWRDDIPNGVRPVWLLDYWVDLAKMIVEQAGCAIVVVGADWAQDKEYARLFVEAWAKAGGDPAMLVNVCGQTHIAECYRVTMGGKCLFSYQSGVGIGSEFLGVKTAIWWRAHGDTREAPGSDGIDESQPGGRHYSTFDERMRNAYSPPWAEHLGLIYGRETPSQIFQMVRKKQWI